MVDQDNFYPLERVPAYSALVVVVVVVFDVVVVVIVVKIRRRLGKSNRNRQQTSEWMRMHRFSKEKKTIENT